jgi:hypothetical protein
MLKTEIADVVRARAVERGLNVEISTSAGSTLLGDDWYRWLASCRYTIGVEGGASVLDRDGSIKACTDRALAARPDATFEELERDCFPGEDGRLALRALSPRHLEACATRTAQILVEGEYNGVLEPGRHYLSLRGDYSNLDDLLDVVAADRGREELVAAAYRDVVASERWTYRALAEAVERELPQVRRSSRAALAAGAAADAASKRLLPLAHQVAMPARRAVYRALGVRGYRRA